MIQPISPYETPAFRRTVVHPDTEAILRGFAERDRQESVAGANGIINGFCFSVLFWFIAWLIWWHR